MSNDSPPQNSNSTKIKDLVRSYDHLQNSANSTIYSSSKNNSPLLENLTASDLCKNMTNKHDDLLNNDYQNQNTTTNATTHQTSYNNNHQSNLNQLNNKNLCDNNNNPIPIQRANTVPHQSPHLNHHGLLDNTSSYTYDTENNHIGSHNKNENNVYYNNHIYEENKENGVINNFQSSNLHAESNYLFSAGVVENNGQDKLPLVSKAYDARIQNSRSLPVVTGLGVLFSFLFLFFVTFRC